MTLRTHEGKRIKAKIIRNRAASSYGILVLVMFAVLLFPVLLFCEDIEVFIKGIDDGKKTTKQQDYQEALINAKLQAVERAGVEITSITKIENFQLKKDTIESKAKGVLLPGFKVMDIGYQADGTYLVILTGKLRTESSAKEFDAALTGLKKIQNMVEVGTSYAKYSEALPEMIFPIKLYIESPKSNPQIIEIMKSAVRHYDNAKYFWRMFIDNRGERLESESTYKPICELLLKWYPEAADRDTVSTDRNWVGPPWFEKSKTLSCIWSKASQDIEKLTKLKESSK